MVWPQNATDQERRRWFRNIRAGQPFDEGRAALDYSLQLAAGVQNAAAWRNQNVAAARPSGGSAGGVSDQPRMMYQDAGHSGTDRYVR